MLGISGCSRVELHDPLRKVHSFKHQHLQPPILDVRHLYLDGIWKCIWMYDVSGQVFLFFSSVSFFPCSKTKLENRKGLGLGYEEKWSRLTKIKKSPNRNVES